MKIKVKVNAHAITGGTGVNFASSMMNLEGKELEFESAGNKRFRDKVKGYVWDMEWLELTPNMIYHLQMTGRLK